MTNPMRVDQILPSLAENLTSTKSSRSSSSEHDNTAKSSPEAGSTNRHLSNQQERTMGISLDDVYASKWLRAKDLNGQPALVTIQEIGMTKFKDGKSQITLTFREQEKPFGCNKTNASNIAKIMNSRDTDDWIGKQIVIFPTEVEFSGEMVDAIRVRAPRNRAPEPPKQKIIVDEDVDLDDVPF